MAREGSVTQVNVPPWLLPIMQGTAGQIGAAQGNLPNISQLYGMLPQLGIAPLSGSQTDLINQIVAQAGGGTNVANAQNLLGQLTSGPIGSSPATQAGMQAFQQLVAPQIEQGAVLAGQGNSGALGEQLQLGATAAAVPLIQQEIQNRQQAIGQYGNLEQLLGQQQQAGLNAAGLPQQIQQQQNQSLYDQLMNQLMYAQGVQMGPEQLFGSTLGASQWGRQSTGGIFSGLF